MNDTDIIQSAYADVLTRLFSVYFSALVAAAGDASAEAQAADAFQAGLALARKARDAASAMAAPPKAQAALPPGRRSGHPR
ncbi:MAG: hypothetical protein J0H50_07465 [Xanthomonadales bacterium]|nr:hypothetical protein [Xanthomonadales bacterium]